MQSVFNIIYCTEFWISKVKLDFVKESYNFWKFRMISNNELVWWIILLFFWKLIFFDGYESHLFCTVISKNRMSACAWNVCLYVTYLCLIGFVMKIKCRVFDFHQLILMLTILFPVVISDNTKKHFLVTEQLLSQYNILSWFSTSTFSTWLKYVCKKC